MKSISISDHKEGVGQEHCDANVLFYDQDEGDNGGGEPRQKVLENGCICDYDSRNASEVHSEHLNQDWVCEQEIMYIFTFPYFGMRLVRVS